MKQKYTLEEATKSSTEYFDGDGLSADKFLDKYALRDIDENLLEKTPTDMHWRIAKEFARVEKKKFKKPMSEDDIFATMDHFRYIVPQGSPMSGIGNNYQTISLSNCFLVETPLDSYGDILRIDEQLVQICKRRGGCGVDISNLRPKGSITHNAARSSTGIISFAKRYSNTISEVGQDGRRGALIITLSVHHPEIMAFIKCKEDKVSITGANISVKLTNEFLDAVTKDAEYELRWPINSPTPKIRQMVKARMVWNAIMENAHKDGEPGLLFWDNIMATTPSNVYPDHIAEGVNPCSEIILPPLDSCRLMLLNLYSFVDKPFTKDATLNYDKLIEYTKHLQRLMDDMVDLEAEKIEAIIKKIDSDPEPQETKERERALWVKILKKCNDGRRTGSGATGLADAVAALGIKYASAECMELCDKIFRTMKLAAYRASVDMAKELGAFGDYDAKKEENSPFIMQIKEEDPQLYADMVKYGRRNIALMTVSPAGTVSIMTRTTSGIEPLFEMKYQRKVKIMGDGGKADFVDDDGSRYNIYKVNHPKIEAWKQVTGETDLKKSPWYGCCANDIVWTDRVKLQGIIQKHICHSISSTVNLPQTATVQDVAAIYEMAWKCGCKGITVYVDKSRAGILTVDDGDILSNEKKLKELRKNHAPKRPKELPCDIYHIKITKKLDKIRNFEYMVLIGRIGNEPYEVFAIENGKYDKKLEHGKIIKESRGRYHLVFEDGTEIKDITSDTTEHEDALTRLVSTGLRHGVNVSYICEQLSKVTGDLLCFSKSISRALKHYIKDGQSSTEECPKCKIKYVFENGCYICKSCGSSRCN